MDLDVILDFVQWLATPVVCAGLAASKVRQEESVVRQVGLYLLATALVLVALFGVLMLWWALALS